MTRKKLSLEAADESYQRRIEANRERRRKAREEQQGRQVQEATVTNHVRILEIEESNGAAGETDVSLERVVSHSSDNIEASAWLTTLGTDTNEPSDTRGTQGRIDELQSTATSILRRGSIRTANTESISQSTTTDIVSSRYCFRSRRSPTSDSSIRSDSISLGPDNSGRGDHNGPLNNTRETCPLVERTSHATVEGEAPSETFGLETLALSDGGKRPSLPTSTSAPALLARDAPERLSEGDDVPGWEAEEGLFVSEAVDAADDAIASQGSTERPVKCETSEEEDNLFCFPIWMQVAPEREDNSERSTTRQETRQFSSDSGSTGEHTPDASDNVSDDEQGEYESESSSASRELGERRLSGDFFEDQGNTYKKIMQDTFSVTCSCHQNAQRTSSGREQTAAPLSLREMSGWIKNELGDLEYMLNGTEPGHEQRHTYEPQKWQRALTACPGPLSLERSEDELPRDSITVERFYDIDSIVLGMRSLRAVPASNDSFRLSFVPPYIKSISGNQILQPHGVEIGRTRHIFLGSFSIGDTTMDVYVFFPNTNTGKPFLSKGQYKKPRMDVRYTLSHERQKEFVDNAVLPALYATVPSIYRQEMPSSFDIAEAKSTSHRERSGGNRSEQGQLGRSSHIRYTVPGHYVGAFGDALIERCNSLRIEHASREESFAYFQNPKFICQIHDTKNMFARPDLRQVLDVFDERILQKLDMDHIDKASSIIDIGFRDMPQPYQDNEGRERHATLLWKKPCLAWFHQQIIGSSPQMHLKEEYFPSYNLRDAFTYDCKPSGISGRTTASSQPGNPSCTKLGVFHAKAYNCDKERFSVFSGDRRMFDEPNLGAMALKDVMMDDIFVASHEASRAVSGAPMRKHLESAWAASKHRLGAVARQSNPIHGYAARKEVTFRLDIILWMLEQGHFAASEDESAVATPPIGSAVQFRLPLDHSHGEHYPYWVLDTAAVNNFVCMSATRFIQPLEHLFQLGGENSDDTAISSTVCARSVAHFYTAQMLLCLLTSSLDAARRWASERWIWDKQWLVKGQKNGQRGSFTRQGLGLQTSIEAYGLVWLDATDIDWLNSHIVLDKLLYSYISRHPRHPRWAAQSNVKRVTQSSTSTAYVIEDLLLKACRLRSVGSHNVTAAHANERIAADIAAQEVAREYSKHLLSKLQSLWARANTNNHTIRKAHPRGPPKLVSAMQDICAPIGSMVTAETVLTIYNEAWRIHAEVDHTGKDLVELPFGIPNWMGKRSPKQLLWTVVVYETLFASSEQTTWARNAFLTLYKRLKALYNRSRHAESDDFDEMFKSRIGRYIVVMFNPDRSKEVNVSPDTKHGLRGLSSFFRIQFWAPLINHTRYVYETAKILLPQYPLTDRQAYQHREMQLHNMQLRQSHLAFTKSPITTAWVYQQTPECIRQLAVDLSSYAESLLQTAAPLQYNGLRPIAASGCWDYEGADSENLALWEVPIEIPGLYAGLMPTIVLPTECALKSVLKMGRSAVSILGLLKDDAYRDASRQLRKLRVWLRIIQDLLDMDTTRHNLMHVRLDALEKGRQRYEDVDGDDKLMQFIGQASNEQGWQSDN